MAKKEAKKAAYKVNTEKRTITIDDTVTATAAEEKDIDRYLKAGYVIKHKSQKRAEQAAERTDSLTDATILEVLKDNEEALNKYIDIKTGKGKGQGFFSAKSWFKDKCKEEYKAYLEKQK